MKSLVDLAVPVVVVLEDRRTARGQVRYYDRDVFSLARVSQDPNY
jgi:hypothetical protein